MFDIGRFGVNRNCTVRLQQKHTKLLLSYNVEKPTSAPFEDADRRDKYKLNASDSFAKKMTLYEIGLGS